MKITLKKGKEKEWKWYLVDEWYLLTQLILYSTQHFIEKNKMLTDELLVFYLESNLWNFDVEQK